MSATAGPRVGPNAILQTIEALTEMGGADLTRRVFDLAGLGAVLDHPPQEMVPQDMAFALHRTIAESLPRDQADRVAMDAGRRTGQYILANRIPRAAQIVLRLLPARMAGPILLKAIEKHAWTFAGSARVSQQAGPPMSFTIHDNPLAVPGCLWHCAVFETLFRTLVHPQTRVQHTECCACGGAACVFTIAV